MCPDEIRVLKNGSLIRPVPVQHLSRVREDLFLFVSFVHQDDNVCCNFDKPFASRFYFSPVRISPFRMCSFDLIMYHGTGRKFKFRPLMRHVRDLGNDGVNSGQNAQQHYVASQKCILTWVGDLLTGTLSVSERTNTLTQWRGEYFYCLMNIVVYKMTVTSINNLISIKLLTITL